MPSARRQCHRPCRNQTDVGHPREELLARLLEQLIDQSRDGQIPDLEAVAAKHSDLVGELQELWATAMIAEDFGSFSDDEGLGPTITMPVGFAAERHHTKKSPGFPERIGDYVLIE